MGASYNEYGPMSLDWPLRDVRLERVLDLVPMNLKTTPEERALLSQNLKDGWEHSAWQDPMTESLRGRLERLG